jgi:hypothetical protein
VHIDNSFSFRPFSVILADEQEPQQGIAHLTEHVAYMGSRKRERLFGTGSQTNAYTDFHHTVFYASCPLLTPRGNQPMLPMALDALVDVMEARVESQRLEKERAAVLSEMTMVNTIEYRVECQILSTLHRENRLAKRFPIGKESLIRSWTTDDVRTWHRTHYRPDNVLLYLVGDINPDEAEKVINEKFGHVSAEKQAAEIKIPEIKKEAAELADAIVAGTVKSVQSWHYPPVRHDWCVPKGTKIDPALVGPDIDYDIHLQLPMPLDDKVALLKTEEVSPGKKIRPHIFRYVELSYSSKWTAIFSIVLITVSDSLLCGTGMNCYSHFRSIYLQSGRWNQLSTWNPSAIVWRGALPWLHCRFGSMSADEATTLRSPL